MHRYAGRSIIKIQIVLFPSVLLAFDTWYYEKDSEPISNAVPDEARYGRNMRQESVFLLQGVLYQVYQSTWCIN